MNLDNKGLPTNRPTDRQTTTCLDNASEVNLCYELFFFVFFFHHYFCFVVVNVVNVVVAIIIIIIIITIIILIIIIKPEVSISHRSESRGQQYELGKGGGVGLLNRLPVLTQL